MESISIQNLGDSLAVGLDFDSLLVILSEFKQDSSIYKSMKFSHRSQRMGNVHVQSFENGWLVFTVFNMLEVWLEESISDHPNGIQVAAVRIFIIPFLNANDLGQNIRAQSFAFP